MRKSPNHRSEKSSSETPEREGDLLGKILVASPAMSNPYFAHTTILVVQSNAEGTAGVILNRPADHSIQQIWTQVSQSPCAREQAFHLGGPLPGPMVALHRQPALGEVCVGEDLYVAAERSLLDRLLAEETMPFRLFVGHAGWGPGQLEKELKQGAWMVLPAGAIEIFAAESELWYRAVREVGASVLRTAIPERLIPPDPNWN
jgi:putative transcriptional regulator